MAYIYRYQIKNKRLRDRTSLTQYTQYIQSVLGEHFSENLKDSFVKDNYFEFSLYASVTGKLCQEMGRKIKIGLYEKLERDEEYGFVRMEQTLYAITYSSKDEQQDSIHIEFIDSKLLDDFELFNERAQYFFEKKTSNGLITERDYSNNVLEIIPNYYIDVLDSYGNKDCVQKLFKNINKSEIDCFFVKGYHRRYHEHISNENMFLLEKGFDTGYIANQNKIMKQEDNKVDYLEIHSLKKQNKKLKEIRKKLNLLLHTTENIEALNIIKENHTKGKRIDYKLQIYNVGQALATSLALKDKPPFLYFDYGMPFGKNSFTRPPQVNMITNRGTTIILSHIHMDHWFRIADDLNACQCNWFIPDQPRKIQLNRAIAGIIVYGGSVNIIKSDIEFGRGKLTYGGALKIKPKRCTHHIHETGLSLRLEATDVQGQELNILIAGDQRYDYIDATQLSDLDLLVASHHGGEFCSSVSGNVPKARNISSTVVYSYGKDNTYKHPSQRQKYYVDANWTKEHHTPNGDYEISISL